MDITALSRRRSEYRALALMYIAQGLPSGLAFYALGTLIRHSGHSVADVGLTGLVFLPWAFKFLWSSLVDNACVKWGHARFIFVTQSLAVIACCVLMGFSPADHLVAMITVVVILNTICATQDIATNAYAVTHMQGKAAGTANAIQVAGFIAGMLLGGGGFLIVHDALGWQSTVACLAAILALFGVILWLDKPWQTPLVSYVSNGITQARLRDLLFRKDLIWALAIALTFKFPGTAVSILVQPWLVDRGVSMEMIGHIQIVSMLATAAGGILLGIPLIRALGNRKAVLISFICAAGMLGIVFLMEVMQIRQVWGYMLALGTQGLFEGAMFVSIWALFMNWAALERAGTDYSVMQCSESIANAMAAGVIGGLGQQLGYANAFGLMWGAAGLCFILIACCLPRLNLYKEAKDKM